MSEEKILLHFSIVQLGSGLFPSQSSIQIAHGRNKSDILNQEIREFMWPALSNMPDQLLGHPWIPTSPRAKACFLAPAFGIDL